MVHIWLAKALKDDDENKSVEHLLKAISLSPVSEEAYREMIFIFRTMMMQNYWKDIVMIIDILFLEEVERQRF